MRRKTEDLAQGDTNRACQLLWQAVVMRALEDLRAPIAPPGCRTDQTVKYVSQEDRDDALRFLLDESPDMVRHRRIVYELAGITDHGKIQEATYRLVNGMPPDDPEPPEEGWLF